MKYSLMEQAQKIADDHFDGHLTIMKFSTNWKVCFGTPDDRLAIDAMPTGDTLEMAIMQAMRRRGDISLLKETLKMKREKGIEEMQNAELDYMDEKNARL